MKKTFVKSAAAFGLCFTLLAGSASASAAYQTGNAQNANGMWNRAGFTRQNTGLGNPGQNGFNAKGVNGQMVISEPGEYRLTGEMRGTVLVDPGQGDVNLVLDNARINGAGAPAIVAVSGDRLNVELADGTRNSVFGGMDNEFGAAVYSDIPVTFEGNGQLDMMSQGPDAIRINDNNLTFNGGDFRIQSGENAMNAENVSFNGGAFTFGDGMNLVAPGANRYMNGGTFQESPAPLGSSQQNRQFPAMPDGQQTQSAMPSANQQSAMPGNNQQSGQQATLPSGNQNGQRNNGQQFPVQGSSQQTITPAGNQNQQDGMPSASQRGEQTNSQQFTPGQNAQQGAPFGGTQNGAAQSTVTSPTAIVSGTTTNNAMSLTADDQNATTYDVSEDSTVKIDASGTYIVTGSASDGSITVKKGTTGVVLVLDDLDLTSTSGAALSINKEAEAQVIVSGNVTLTDNENPDDEYSTDAEVADAYDGAAIKVKANAVAFITGDGTLTVNGNAKNGIKAGDDSSLIIGGDVTLNVNAVNDGINGNYDVTILSGTVNVSAGDDGIHADHILTIGEDGEGPNLTISKSNEGLEGTVVNIAGGTVNVTATDDGINAANSDGTYASELDYSVNITGGDVTVNTRADGIDSNGNVNLVSGSAQISSAYNGGDAGIDFDGDLYVSDSFELNNTSGVAGPDNMMGGLPGQMGGMGQKIGALGQMGGGNQMGGASGQSSMAGPKGGSQNAMNNGFRVR